MARIAGIDLPDEKRADIGLTYIFGIGPANVKELLDKAKVEGTKRLKDFTDDDINRIQKVLDTMVVEGDLRRDIAQNIRRLEDIGAYRGLRHRKGLPTRGQRTRSNGRTRRGKRKTIGSVKKETR